MEILNCTNLAETQKQITTIRAQIYPTICSSKEVFFLIKIKLRPTVATVKYQTIDYFLIDSDGTHHFLHTKDRFLDHHSINNQTI